MTLRAFEQVQKSMFYLSTLKILPTTGSDGKHLFRSRTPYLQLSWFSLLTSIFGFVNVLIITRFYSLVFKTLSGIHPDPKEIVPKGTRLIGRGFCPLMLNLSEGELHHLISILTELATNI